MVVSKRISGEDSMSPTEKSNIQDERHPLAKTNLVRNTAVVVIIAIVLFFLQAVPVSQSEPILAYRVGVLYLAFAAALILVASRFRNDREWLMIPITVIWRSSRIHSSR